MKKNIAAVILMIMALVMFGCSSDERNYVENNPDTTRDASNSWLAGLITRVPVLFGVGDGLLTAGQVRSKGAMSGSSLYWINTIDGSATLIGDIGYSVNGIAYDAITNKLYGITSGIYASGSFKTPTDGGSELIEIDMATGAGSLIGPIISNKKDPYYYFSQPSFNALGTLYAINNTDKQLCTINVTTAEANCFNVKVDPYAQKANPEERGQAFNNFDVLTAIVPGVSADKEANIETDDDDSSGGARIYTFDPINNELNYQRPVYGLPYNMAPNGDFDPLTGLYWGLDSLDARFVLYDANVEGTGNLSGKNLLVIDMNNGTLMQTIPTIGNLNAVTFGYLDASTLIKMGSTSLIDFLCPNDPN